MPPHQILRQGPPTSTGSFTGGHLRPHTPSGVPPPSRAWDCPGPSASAGGWFSWLLRGCLPSQGSGACGPFRGGMGVESMGALKAAPRVLPSKPRPIWVPRG